MVAQLFLAPAAIQRAQVNLGDVEVHATTRELVDTGWLHNGEPVKRVLSYDHNGTPVVSGYYIFDENGELVDVSGGQPFVKPAAPTAAENKVTHECIYITDTVTGESREARREITTAYNVDGTVASVTPRLVEEDLATAITLGANEVWGKEPECVTTGSEQVDVTGATATSLTVPANSKAAKFQVDPDGAAIRYTFDGSTPDNNSLAASAGSWITICKASDLNGFRALAADASGALAPAETAQLNGNYVSTELHEA